MGDVPHDILLPWKYISMCSHYNITFFEGTLFEIEFATTFPHFNSIWVYIRQHKCDNAAINQTLNTINYYKDTRNDEM